jgi:PEGA domain-containing protein
MKRLMVGTAILVFLLATKSCAQSGAAIPQADSGHVSQASCVILKRIGRVGRVTSHLYSFGLRGKQFRYIEGKLPEGFSLHGKMTDHDVRNLQAYGAEVIVLESHYTSGDLKEARANCRGEGGKRPNQAETKASVAQAPPMQAQVQAPAAIASTPITPRKADDSASSSDSIEAALIEVSSTPAGAEVDVDGSLYGRTPSTLILSPGSHEIAIKKSGFMVWRKKFKLSSGHSNVNVELVPKAK